MQSESTLDSLKIRRMQSESILDSLKIRRMQSESTPDSLKIRRMQSESTPDSLKCAAQKHEIYFNMEKFRLNTPLTCQLVYSFTKKASDF